MQCIVRAVLCIKWWIAWGAPKFGCTKRGIALKMINLLKTRAACQNRNYQTRRYISVFNSIAFGAVRHGVCCFCNAIRFLWANEFKYRSDPDGTHYISANFEWKKNACKWKINWKKCARSLSQSNCYIFVLFVLQICVLNAQASDAVVCLFFIGCSLVVCAHTLFICWSARARALSIIEASD